MPYKDKDKQKEYGRQWIATRRSEWFSGKRCATWWCGNPINLELDHVDPTKKVHHAIWSWSKERREAELAKCQVLCEPCHLVKTISQMSKAFEHGTGTEYSRGCRCTPCKQWKSAENKRNRRR